MSQGKLKKAGQSDTEYEEHVLSVITALFRNASPEMRKRLLGKFVENNFEKVRACGINKDREETGDEEGGGRSKERSQEIKKSGGRNKERKVHNLTVIDIMGKVDGGRSNKNRMQ